MSLFRSGFLLLFVLATLVLPAGGGTAGEAGGVKPLRTLTVVVDDNYPPYVFRDASGTLTGYLVDLWRLWEELSLIHI